MATADSATADKENSKVNHLILEIHSALTTNQRLQVLTRLRKTLQQNESLEPNLSFASLVNTNDYVNRDCFDSTAANLIDKGIINALSLKFHRLLRTHGSTLAELELICQCFALLFAHLRRNYDALHQLICDQRTRFVVLLTEAVSMASQKRQERPRVNTASFPCVQHSVLTIFNIISASAAGTTLLLKCRVVAETIVTILCDTETTDDMVVKALGILKNMTYYEEDCRASMIKLSGFLSGLTALPNRSHALSLKSRQRLSAVIRNLAISVECRSLLVAHPMAVGALIRLMTWEPTCKNAMVCVDICNLRRNLLDTLISLSMDHNSALLLIFHGDGVLLSILKRYLKENTDTVLRKKSASTLRLLANEVSAPLLIHDAELMHTLSDAALRDESLDVRKEALEAFTRCAALVQVEHQPHYQAVLDALTALAQQRHRPKSVSVDLLARALKEQSFRVCNRKPMAEQRVLLETVAQIAMSRDVSSTTAAQDACRALMHLSTEEANLKRLADTPMVLDALLATVSTYSVNSIISNRTDAFPVEKEDAVKTLVNLIALPTNRTLMVKHGCLLQTLIQVTGVIPKTRPNVKEEVKVAILLLAKAL